MFVAPKHDPTRLFTVTSPSTIRCIVVPLTMICSPELQNPPMASTPEQPTMSLTSLNGSSNWMVLTPSHLPPATEWAGTVAGPTPSVIDAVGTFVHAVSALATIVWVVAAPSAGSAFATRNVTGPSSQRTGGLPRKAKPSVTMWRTTSSRSEAARPDGIVSCTSDAASARSRATNDPRRRTSSRGSVRRASGTATDAASRWYFPSASAFVRSRPSDVRLRKSSTRSPVANDGAP